MPEDYYDPIPGQDLPPQQGGAAPPPGGAQAIPIHGTPPPQSVVDVLLPGYKIQGDQYVWAGGANQQPNTFVDGGAAFSQYLGSLGTALTNRDWRGFFEGLFKSQGVDANQTVLTTSTLGKALVAAGFKVSPGNQTNGAISKIQKPGFSGNQGWVRVITGDPINGGSWDWVDQPDGPTPPPDPTLTKPFGQEFAPPTDKTLPQMPDFAGPEFQAPTFADMLKDPGYQFRVQQGEQGVEQSAAARGVLNTGGTLKDILNYGQSAASQEYGNVWNRSLDQYDRAYRGALDRFQPQMQGWQTLFATGANQNNVNWQHAYDKWLQDYTIYRNQQNDTFDKNFKTATA